MTTQKNIDYRIEQLEKLSGLKLKDAWLYQGKYAKSHRLEGKETDYITPRYSSKKQFCYVLESMINLLCEIREKRQSEKHTSFYEEGKE